MILRGWTLAASLVSDAPTATASAAAMQASDPDGSSLRIPRWCEALTIQSPCCVAPDATCSLTAADYQVAQFADYCFQYDDQRRVTREIVRAGAMAYSFAYQSNDDGDGGPNTWHRRTTETRPDGSQNIVYTNRIGRVLVYEFRKGDESWTQAHRYDDRWRMILHAQPSAVTGYDDSVADLNVSLREISGVIHRWEYYGEDADGDGAAPGRRAATG